MILPPLVHAPFHYSHRAEVRDIPYPHGSVWHANTRFWARMLLAGSIVALLLAWLFPT